MIQLRQVWYILYVKQVAQGKKSQATKTHYKALDSLVVDSLPHCYFSQ